MSLQDLKVFYNGAKAIVTAYREEKLNNYCKHKQKVFCLPRDKLLSDFHPSIPGSSRIMEEKTWDYNGFCCGQD